MGSRVVCGPANMIRVIIPSHPAATRATDLKTPGISALLLHFRTVHGGRFLAVILPDRHGLVGIKSSATAIAVRLWSRVDYVARRISGQGELEIGRASC